MMSKVMVMVMVAMLNIPTIFGGIKEKVVNIKDTIVTTAETTKEDVSVVKYVEKEFMGKGDEDEHYMIYRCEDGSYRIVYSNKMLNYTDKWTYVEIADYDLESGTLDYVQQIGICSPWFDDVDEYVDKCGYIDNNSMVKLAIHR